MMRFTLYLLHFLPKISAFSLLFCIFPLYSKNIYQNRIRIEYKGNMEEMGKNDLILYIDMYYK